MKSNVSGKWHRKFIGKRLNQRILASGLAILIVGTAICLSVADHDMPESDTGSEIKTLSKGWNWVSFPRLERVDNGSVDVVPLFQSIPDWSDVTGLEAVKKTSSLTYTLLQGWDPSYYEIISSELIKIDVDPERDWLMELTGSRLPADFTLGPLDTSETHWLGYWLPTTQNMDDAFGTLWGNVESVKAEEWYYAEQPVNGDNRDPIVEHTPSTTMRALEYGKGYEVTFKAGTSVANFGWTQSSEPPAEGYERAQTEYFECEEQPDYEVIDLLSIPEDVVEIGVFRDDVCAGAVAVQDSCEQILVYLEPTAREQVPYHFEIITNSRSAQPVENYKVLNQRTGSFESMALVAGRQTYSVVRFGDLGLTPGTTPPVKQVELHGNYPNPFNPDTRISFSLPAQQNVCLEVYNIRGQEVKSLANGKMTEGLHTIVWDGTDSQNKSVGSGLYFYRLKTADAEFNRKMVLLK